MPGAVIDASEITLFDMSCEILNYGKNGCNVVNYSVLA